MIDDPNLSDPSLYINRELSWLEFNERVLAQARSDSKCTLDRTDACQINGTGPTDLPLPANHRLIPGVLHAYRAGKDDLVGYVEPTKDGELGDDDDEDNDQ